MEVKRVRLKAKLHCFFPVCTQILFYYCVRLSRLASKMLIMMAHERERFWNKYTANRSTIRMLVTVQTKNACFRVQIFLFDIIIQMLCRRVDRDFKQLLSAKKFRGE